MESNAHLFAIVQFYSRRSHDCELSDGMSSCCVSCVSYEKVCRKSRLLKRSKDALHEGDCSLNRLKPLPKNFSFLEATACFLHLTFPYTPDGVVMPVNLARNLKEGSVTIGWINDMPLRVNSTTVTIRVVDVVSAEFDEDVTEDACRLHLKLQSGRVEMARTGN